jgi:hypothetical protein
MSLSLDTSFLNDVGANHFNLPLAPSFKHRHSKEVVEEYILAAGTQHV